jgi:hypothetical protein
MFLHPFSWTKGYEFTVKRCYMKYKLRALFTCTVNFCGNRFLESMSLTNKILSNNTLPHPSPLLDAKTLRREKNVDGSDI